MQREPDIATIEADLAGARDIAREFAAQIRGRFGERVRRLTLYGSAARGDWAAESDIDVLVLLDDVADADQSWLAGTAFRLGVLDNGVVLQPLCMPERDFARMKARERLFALSVEQEGIAL